MSSTFKMNLSSNSSNKDDLEKEVLYSVVVPVDDYTFMKEVLVLKAQKRETASNKTLFLEGFELLKSKNMEIKDDKPIKRRYYRGGNQKVKGETISTSVTIPKKNIYWIDNYIFEKREKNMYFSKPDFIKDLINELRIVYGKSI
ncbi:MAG: hypothetical protein HC854_15600 [Flavobacterium sp.]|nr:hypothetical protein [Flavobacterium sp.]